MINQLSEKLLYQVKLTKPYSKVLSQLEKYDFSLLQKELVTDDLKKAFWINVYNALFVILKRDQDFSKPSIYKNKLIMVAGKPLSLDDIEHGIFRRFRYKYSLGYFKKWFVPKTIKMLAVDALDYRIHFALNCGAKSCPPIAFYNSEKIESQLQLAELSFLEGETTIDLEDQKLKTSMILKWYIGDFGGLRGIKKMLSRVLKKDFSKFTIGFKPYNWEEDLNNYQ